MTPASFSIELPDAPPRPQDEETVVVRLEDGREEEIRLHEYARMYSTPGLYESVVQDLLESRSPQHVSAMMADEWRRLGHRLNELRVLDVGAGNGVVGELLAKEGVDFLVGLDNIPEAEAAAERDRPGIYSAYLTADLTALGSAEREQLVSYGFNGLTCVGALGFGDIPPEAFAQALNLTGDGSLIGFTIKEDFLQDGAKEGFAGFIQSLVDRGRLEVLRRERFRHRRAVTGESLYYVAVVGLKVGPVPVPGA